MAKSKPNEILNRVEKEGFENVWLESASFLPEPTRRLELINGRRGRSIAISFRK